MEEYRKEIKQDIDNLKEKVSEISAIKEKLSSQEKHLERHDKEIDSLYNKTDENMTKQCKKRKPDIIQVSHLLFPFIFLTFLPLS